MTRDSKSKAGQPSNEALPKSSGERSRLLTRIPAKILGKGHNDEGTALDRFMRQKHDDPFNTENVTRGSTGRGPSVPSVGSVGRFQERHQHLSDLLAHADEQTINQRQSVVSRSGISSNNSAANNFWVAQDANGVDLSAYATQTNAHGNWTGDFDGSSTLPQSAGPGTSFVPANSFFPVTNLNSVPSRPYSSNTRTKVDSLPQGYPIGDTKRVSSDGYGKRPRKRSPSLVTLAKLQPGHRYYEFFKHREYDPPQNTKKAPIGQSSLDHTPDSKIHLKLATTLFQHDPILNWPLRDVAEAMPTKINEKEENHERQLGIFNAKAKEEKKEEKKSRKETLKTIGQGFTNRKKNPKRAKTEEDDTSGVGQKTGNERAKARKNWRELYKARYPDVKEEDIPCQYPTYRQTVQAVIHAGQPPKGPKDINTCFITAIQRCEDPEYRSLLIEKLKSIPLHYVMAPSCSKPPHSTSSESEEPKVEIVLQDEGIYGSVTQAPALDEPVEEQMMVSSWHTGDTLRPGSIPQPGNASFSMGAPIPLGLTNIYPSNVSVTGGPTSPFVGPIPMPAEPVQPSQFDYQPTEHTDISSQKNAFSDYWSYNGSDFQTNKSEPYADSLIDDQWADHTIKRVQNINYPNTPFHYQ